MFERLRYYLKFLKSLFEINARLMWGMWRLTKLKQPAITVFGGSRIKHNSVHSHAAAHLAKKLVAHGYSIITGGGPGIMEAANYGAMEYVKECKLADPSQCNVPVSAGIGLLQLNLEHANIYTQETITMSHFFSRKWLLVRYSQGFVIFPGGFGTLDELFEIVTLRQTNKMQQAPIILINKDYWQPIIDWQYEKALKNGLISKDDCSIFTVLDSVDDAFDYITETVASIAPHKNGRIK